MDVQQSLWMYSTCKHKHKGAENTNTQSLWNQKDLGEAGKAGVGEAGGAGVGKAGEAGVGEAGVGKAGEAGVGKAGVG